jgi:quercetin dioxygenase-like cupin family protein
MMEAINRRSALAVGLGAASVLVIGGSGRAEAAVEQKTIAKGVVQRNLGEGQAIIPGYGKVMLRDIVIQPGASTPPNNAMKNAMVCHVTQGQLEVVQDGKTFTAKTNHVWTCNVGTVEQSFNKGKSVAIMRITDLLPT